MPDGSVEPTSAPSSRKAAIDVVTYDARGLCLSALARIGPKLEGLSVFDAIVLGVPRDGTTTGEIVTKDRFAKGGTYAIPRSLDHFGWPDGRGLLFCDGDEIDGLQEVLCELYPPFADIAVLIRPSASASVIDPATGMASKSASTVIA